MIINCVKSFVFLPSPHTASRAVSSVLDEMEGSESYEGVLPYHSTWHDAQLYLTHLNFKKNFTVFYSVRHPGDWLVTRWMANGKTRGDFSVWIRTWPRHLFSKFRRDTELFIRYEHLEEDILRLLGETVKLERDPSHSTRDKKPWQTYWNKHDAEWAGAYFEDFCLYGYTMRDL